MGLLDLWCEQRQHIVTFVTRRWLERMLGNAAGLTNVPDVQPHFSPPGARHPLHGPILGEMQGHPSALLQQLEDDLLGLGAAGQLPSRSQICDLRDVRWNNAWGGIGEIRAFAALSSIPELDFSRNTTPLPTGSRPDFVLSVGAVVGDVKTVSNNELHLQLEQLQSRLLAMRPRRLDCGLKLVVTEGRGLVRLDDFRGEARVELDHVEHQVSAYIADLDSHPRGRRCWTWSVDGRKLVTISVSGGAGAVFSGAGTCIRNHQQRTRNIIRGNPGQLDPSRPNIRVVVDRPLVDFGLEHTIGEVLSGYHWLESIAPGPLADQRFQTGMWSTSDSEYCSAGQHVSAVLLLHLMADGLNSNIEGALFIQTNARHSLTSGVVAALERIARRFPCTERHAEPDM